MRSRVEATLRAAGLAALVVWVLLGVRPRGGRDATAGAAGLSDALARWTTADPVGAVHVRLDTAPDATHAAWLSALRAAGIAVGWHGDVPPMAIETFAARDPSRGVFVAASTAGDAVLRDDLGPLDTLRGGFTVLRLPSGDGRLALVSGRHSARATPPAGAPPKRVLVAGDAGWEPKFVIAALEESGWTVDARLALGPGHEVEQGGRAALDTGRHAAVVLLDSAAAERTRGIAAFVRAGGGVVLSGDASRARAVSELVAWTARQREMAPLGTPPADTAWRGLSRVELSPAADRGAIPLERRGGNYAVAARRHRAGRVAAVGYDQTWRWRMAGAGNSVAEHREWWSRVVASVALSDIPSALPVIPSAARDLQFGSAPVASVHATLGPPAGARGAVAAWWTSPALANLLGVIALATLLAEWLLRRSRGAR